MTGTWLNGPAAALDEHEQQDWRGQRLGLPESGQHSLPSLAHRAVALLFDWLLSYALVLAFIGLFHPQMLPTGEFASTSAWATPLVFAVSGVVFVAIFAQTPGQAVGGLGVARVDYPAERVGLWRSTVRMMLILFLLPALVQDEDGRGLHDRATGTAVIRSR